MTRSLVVALCLALALVVVHAPQPVAAVCDTQLTCFSCLQDGAGCRWAASKGWCRTIGSAATTTLGVGDAWLSPVGAGDAAHCLANTQLRSGSHYRPWTAAIHLGDATVAWGLHLAAANAAAAHAPVPVAANGVAVYRVLQGGRFCEFSVGAKLNRITGALEVDEHAPLINTPDKFQEFLVYLRTARNVPIGVMDPGQSDRAILNDGAHFGLATWCVGGGGGGLGPDALRQNELNRHIKLYARYKRDTADITSPSGDPVTQPDFPGAFDPVYSPADSDGNLVPRCVSAADLSTTDLAAVNAIVRTDVLAHRAISLRKDDTRQTPLGAPSLMTDDKVTRVKNGGGGAALAPVETVVDFARDAYCFYRVASVLQAVGGAKFDERLRRTIGMWRRPFGVAPHHVAGIAKANELFLYRQNGGGAWARLRLITISNDGEHAIVQADHGLNSFVNVERTAAQLDAAGWRMQTSDLPPGILSTDAHLALESRKTDIWHALLNHEAKSFDDPVPYRNAKTDVGLRPEVQRKVMPLLFHRTHNSVGPWVGTLVGIITEVVPPNVRIESTGNFDSTTFTAYAPTAGAHEYYTRGLLPAVFPSDSRSVRAFWDHNGQCTGIARCANDLTIAAVWNGVRLGSAAYARVNGGNDITFDDLPNAWFAHNLWRRAGVDALVPAHVAPQNNAPLDVWTLLVADTQRQVLDSLRLEAMAVGRYAYLVAHPPGLLRLRVALAGEDAKEDHLISQFFSNAIIDTFVLATDGWTRVDVLGGALTQTLSRLATTRAGVRSPWVNMCVPPAVLSVVPAVGALPLRQNLDAEFHATRQGIVSTLWNTLFADVFHPDLAGAAHFPRAGMKTLFVALMRVALQGIFDYSAIWRTYAFGEDLHHAATDDVFVYGSHRARSLRTLPPTHPTVPGSDTTEAVTLAELKVLMAALHVDLIQNDAAMGRFADAYFEATKFRFSDDGINNLPPPRPLTRAAAASLEPLTGRLRKLKRLARHRRAVANA